jgi:hypothetical protein
VLKWREREHYYRPQNGTKEYTLHGANKVQWNLVKSQTICAGFMQPKCYFFSNLLVFQARIWTSIVSSKSSPSNLLFYDNFMLSLLVHALTNKDHKEQLKVFTKYVITIQ